MTGKTGETLRKCFVLTLSMSLIFAGNLASARADEPDIDYVNCSAGGFITIQDSVLISSDDCAGSLDIPLYVIAIDPLVFFNNSALFELKFDRNSALQSIGASAFQSSGLNQITIPASVTSIGNEAFAETAVLAAVSFASNSSLQTIGAGAFQRSGIKDIAIPSSVTSIGPDAFADTTNLVSVSTDDASSLQTISAGAFQRSSLTDITIPASVTSIGPDAFADASNLINVVFLGNAPTLGSDVFSGISQDSFAYVSPDATGFDSEEWSGIRVKYAGRINCSTSGYVVVVEGAVSNDQACAGDLEIPSDVSAIAEGVFSDSVLLRSVSFTEQSSLSVINPFAFANSSLTSITIPSSTSLIMEKAFANTNSLLSVSFDSDSKLETIGDGAFRGSSLTEIYIPASVTSIGEMAFANTPRLASVSFDQGIQLPAFASGLFQEAVALTFITIPPSVRSIGANAFKDSALTSLSVPLSVISIGNQAFANNSGLSDVTFEQGCQLDSIGKGVFQNASLLTYITFPPSITSIGVSAFEGSGLTSISIPASIIALGNQAFADTADLTEVTFDPDSTPTTIGASAFSGSGITSITIPAGFTAIGDQAFANMSDLAEIKFDPDSSLATIGANAFVGSALASITIPAGVTSIGDQAFAGVLDLADVTFDAGSSETGAALDSIGTGAFKNTGITQVTIPANVTSIGEQAFSNLPFLTDFTVASENKNFESDSGVLFNFGKTKLIQYPLGHESDLESNINLYSVPNSVTEIGSYAFSGSYEGTDIEFASDAALETISANAFSGSGITNIAIPASVTAIGEQAFANTPNLNSLTFAPGIAIDKIENSTFENSVISSLTIPQSVATIGTNAFKASGLTQVIIPASVTAIGEQAFANTLSLGSITFAPGAAIDRIENSTFMSSAITSISIPDGVTAIGSGAFQDASELAEVTIPSSLLSIGSNAFSATTGLRRLYFFGDAPSVQSTFDQTSQAVAYKKSSAQGFTSPTWKGIPISNGIFTVTFDSQGGSTLESKLLLFGKPISVAPAVPTRAGFTFLGWAETIDGPSVTFPYLPNTYGNKILYAKWKSNKASLDLTKPKPSITGKAISSKKGTNKLTAKPGTWIGSPPPVITYAWFACKSQVKAMTPTIPRTCAPIPKVTKNVLPVLSSYKGKFISVKVTGTSAGTTPTFYLSVSTLKVK